MIDLLDGNVVHAQRGQRSLYRPIQSALSAGSSPRDIVQALLELYPFTKLYIADLDAIQGQGDNSAIIRQMKSLYPHLDIWLDAGFRHPHEMAFWHAEGIACVLGSESLQGLDHYLQLKAKGLEQTILSLDFTTVGYVGPVELLESPALWPDKVITMTLPQVGSNLGPDFGSHHEVLHATRSSGTSASRIYAAGGVRGLDDLMQLRAMGIAGVLVASALHNGTLAAHDIAAVEEKNFQ